MIKYSVDATSCCIEQVDVTRETKGFVFLKSGHRVAKRSGYTNYFNSFNDAKEFLISSVDDEIRIKKNMLDSAIKKKEKIIKITEKK